MQYSVVNSTKIDLSDRIDAEYFEPSYLSLENTIKKKQVFPLRKYVQLVSSAFYPAATHLYEFGDVPFIRCVDCINYPVISSQQNGSFERIPQDFIDEYRNVQTLKENEIVITKVGTPCYASIVSGIDEVALSRTVLGVKHIKGIDPFYLTAFLRSKYGFQQLYRQRELTIQYQLTLERVGKVLIFKPENENFEKLIAKIFKVSQEQTTYSQKLYRKAEEKLLDELGLLDWQPPHQLTFVSDLASATSAERLDAEYFQPKFDHFLKNSKSEFVPLSKLTKNLSNGKTPAKDEYTDSGVPILKVGGIAGKWLIDESDEYVTESWAENNKKGSVKTFDLLMICAAHHPKYIGQCGLWVKEKKTPVRAVGELIILRFTDSVLPGYMTVYLNLEIVRSVVQKYIRGNTAHLYPRDLQNLPVPILSMKTQQKIHDGVFTAYNARQVSKQLLDIAKSAVEISIERNETAAETWLKKELQKLGLENYL